MTLINAETTLLGIFGWPVKHSRSPAMHHAAAQALGLNLAYIPFPVDPARLGDAVRGVRALGLRGVNVTLPHKEQVMAFLDDVHPDARAIGAVNTLVHESDGTLRGENTDAPGLVRSLEEARVPLDDARVLVLGAGGAARAAVVGLARRGAAEVVVVARRAEQAQALAADLNPAIEGRVRALGERDVQAVRDAYARTTLLVQATSATLAGRPDAQAFADALPLEHLPVEAHVVDLVYQPRETTVMARASARGLRCVDGLGMLVHQGALAFTRWTGHEAPVDVMRAALEASLA
ncbi:MAG: shikimate dehydrogenase [Myxococcales bacterium]|nr:shikimate dehydrogenase [Myxococcales bacterium]MCB9629930.1 shikimate dehydrogenase [Sandaracinaceae bacterium]